MRTRIIHACLASVLLMGPACLAQTTPQAPARPPAPAADPNEALFQIISAQDTALFDAVNSCNLPKVKSMFAEDVEFYHDRVDPQYGREIVVENIMKNLCGQVQRELVAGSLEVYPIHNYGAVEIGVHRFHHPGAKDHDVLGEAKFIHLWRLKDGSWQITRVISYDHGTVK